MIYTIYGVHTIYSIYINLEDVYHLHDRYHLQYIYNLQDLDHLYDLCGLCSHLLLDGVAALLRDVDEVQHAALEVGQRRDGLHLDRVALLERMVQDAGSVHHLVRRVKSEVERSNIFSSINYIVRVGVDFYIGFVWSVLDRLGLSLGSS